MLSKSSDEAESLDRTISELELEMRSHEGDSEEYATCLNRLERLYKLKEKHSKKRISPETWLVVGANLAGIIIIVAYEHGHALTSRAITQVGKLH